MAIAVAARYKLRVALFSEEIRLGEPISAEDLLLIHQNATFEYAAENLRPAMEGAWPSGVKTTQGASPTAREVIFKDTLQIGEARDTLHYVLDGKDIDWQIEIWDHLGTTSLASANGTIGGTRALASGTLALATTADDVIVEVQGRLNGAAAEAFVYGVRVLEEIVAAADLPG